MAVTTDLVKRLILEYIGGKKVLGNPAKTFCSKKLVVVQRQGSNLLSSLKSFVSNPSLSLTGMVGQLTTNPISSVIGDMTGNLNNLVSQTIASGLPGSALSQLTSVQSSFTTALSDLQQHTDILSGQITDPETILGAGKISFSTLMNIDDPTQVQGLASALFSDQTFSSISNSLNMSIAGGAADIAKQVQTATDKVAATANLCDTLQNHVDAINQIISNDDSAYASYQSDQDMQDTLLGMIPSSLDNPVFQRISTQTFNDFLGS